MGVPGLPDEPLTNRAARRLIPLRVMGWISLASLVLFLSLTAIELWAPRAAVRLAGWGMLPGAVLRPARPAERPERGFPAPVVVTEKDPRLDGPKGRPLVGLSGRFDPQSPLDTLIPGEATNVGLKVSVDARHRDKVSGRGAQPVTDPVAAEEGARALARAEAAVDFRRAVLKHRFRIAVGIAAFTAFIMFVGSGFLASLFRPHPGRWTGKKGADGF